MFLTFMIMIMIMLLRWKQESLFFDLFIIMSTTLCSPVGITVEIFFIWPSMYT